MITHLRNSFNTNQNTQINPSTPELTRRINELINLRTGRINLCILVCFETGFETNVNELSSFSLKQDRKAIANVCLKLILKC